VRVVTNAAPNSDADSDSSASWVSESDTNSKYSPSTDGNGTPMSSWGSPSMSTRMRAAWPSLTSCSMSRGTAFSSKAVVWLVHEPSASRTRARDALSLSSEAMVARSCSSSVSVEASCWVIRVALRKAWVVAAPSRWFTMLSRVRPHVVAASRADMRAALRVKARVMRARRPRRGPCHRRGHQRGRRRRDPPAA
jgi:hypothetical protein